MPKRKGENKLKQKKLSYNSAEVDNGMQQQQRLVGDGCPKLLHRRNGRASTALSLPVHVTFLTMILAIAAFICTGHITYLHQ